MVGASSTLKLLRPDKDDLGKNLAEFPSWLSMKQRVAAGRSSLAPERTRRTDTESLGEEDGAPLERPAAEASLNYASGQSHRA